MVCKLDLRQLQALSRNDCGQFVHTQVPVTKQTTSRRALMVMLCGWGGYRRSGVTPVMRHRFSDILTWNTAQYNKKDMYSSRTSRSADKVATVSCLKKLSFRVPGSVWKSSITDTMKVVWETVPSSRSGKAEVALSELSSCARLDGLA